MGRVAVNIRGDGLAELLEDPRVLGLWELLRRSARPLTIKELSDAARCRASDVQRAIDALVIHGLAKPVRVAEHRPEATYRSAGNSIAVCADHASDDAILKEATRKLSEAADRLPVAKRSSRGAAASRAEAAEPVRFAMPVHLDAADHAELTRRIEELQTFIQAIGERCAAPDRPTPELCDHVFAIRLEPLIEPCLPMPVLRRQAGAASEHGADAPAPRRRGRPIATRLSRREWDVALVLVRGLTREEAARELRLSANTVATLTKRIYRKLGIGRRAQLAERLRAESPMRRH